MALKKHVIIVGAGPGGMTAAMILAHRGLKVTVFESQPYAGGRNSGFTLGDFTFDRGPTFLMMDFILKEMFSEAGRKIEDYLTFTRLDTLYDLKFDDRDVRSFFNTEQMKTEIRNNFPGNEEGLNRFLVKEGKRYEMLFPCIQKDYSKAHDMASWPLIRALPYLGLGSNMFATLGDYFKPDKLKLSFTFQSKYLGMSPWECPTLFTMIPYIEHAYGIYHVQGGLHRIPEAMAKILKEEGGTLNLATPVKALMLEHTSVKGVKLANGEKVYADDVFINADFAYAMSNLVAAGAVKKYSAEKLEKMDFSCSTFMLYLGLKKQYPLAHHTVVFAKDYRRNVDEIFKKKVPSDDMSIYVQNPGFTDGKLAPPGKSAVYVLVPAPNLFGGTDWTKEKESYRDKVLNVLMNRTPMKDLLNQIEVEKIVTPADWERDHNIFRGAVFNLSHKMSQLLYFRPHNAFSELENCYLVGGGTHPGSGLPTIYESARISANLLCRKHGIPYHRPLPLHAMQTVGER
jgi:phytoene desaturase